MEEVETNDRERWLFPQIVVISRFTKNQHPYPANIFKRHINIFWMIAAIKPPSGFELANIELVVHNYSFSLTNVCIKDLKYKLFKKLVMPPSYKSIWLLQQCIIMSCNGVLICPPSSNKNSSFSKPKYPSRRVFQSYLISGSFYHPPYSPKNFFQLPSTRDKRFWI